MMALLIIALSSMGYANAGWSTGMATYYESDTVLNDDGNACGMSGTASAYKNTMYAAIAGSEFDSGYGCGKCFQVKGTGAYSSNNPSCKFDTKTITIQAIDQCPSNECSASHFDLSKDAMIAITGSKEMAETCGEISMKYKRVDCSAIKTNFYIKNKSGTSMYWYGFKLNDVNDDGAIKSVVLYKGSSKVTTCSKSDGSSYWLCKGTITKELPLSIAITSDGGKTVTATNCITSFSGNKVMTCNTNLNKGSSFTEEEEPSHSQYWYTGVIAVVLLSCIICGVVGFFYIKRRKQKAKDAVSFMETDGDKATQAGDGDSEATGYDMNPIDTAGGDTPNSQTPADTPVADDDHDEEQEIEIEVAANDQVTLS